MTLAAPASAALSNWLEYIERVHPRAIEMGLGRVATVRKALALTPAFPIITVGGTNGKGSACAMLEAIFAHARYHVGCYTSPHLLRYNERIRVDGTEASDDALVTALKAVEAARGDIPLTYFEFSTLAAMWLFAREGVDVGVLEVGLGGRLDAVNAFDADCAMLMSVELDHMDYLGATREAIGFEKAGIFRAQRPAICADRHPPTSVLEQARAVQADLLLIGRDFGFEAEAQQWRYWGPGGDRHGLPHPALRGAYQVANAAAVLAALDTMRGKPPVSADDVRTGLLTAENPGRYQVLPGVPTVILDVAHNPAAARALAGNLSRTPVRGTTFAVFSMLRDKDIDGVVDAVRDHIDEWLIAPSEGARGADVDSLREALARARVEDRVYPCGDVGEAYLQACDRAVLNDRIVVFGSFYTVAAVMTVRERRAR